MTQDQREFAEFYAAAWDDCLRIVMVSVGSQVLSEDLVAEAFTRAWASWPKVRGLVEPRAWVIRVALNAHVSWWRRRRREVAQSEVVQREVAQRERALGRDDRAAAAGAASLDSSLVAALRRLPVRQRQVIALRLLLDLDTATTAEMLGMSASTVATHLQRAITALRREIPALDDQELTR